MTKRQDYRPRRVLYSPDRLKLATSGYKSQGGSIREPARGMNDDAAPLRGATPYGGVRAMIGLLLGDYVFDKPATYFWFAMPQNRRCPHQ